MLVPVPRLSRFTLESHRPNVITHRDLMHQRWPFCSLERHYSFQEIRASLQNHTGYDLLSKDTDSAICSISVHVLIYLCDL